MGTQSPLFDISELVSKSTRQHAALFCLPPELRNCIWKLLITSQDSDNVTYGRGSGISIEILSTCIQAYVEARALLYQTRHVVQATPMDLKWTVLSNARYLTVLINYGCVHRGDCEIQIRRRDKLLADAEFVGYHLHTNYYLRELHIELCSEDHRGRGSKRLRSENVKRQMDDILLPFAFLRKDVKVTVGGFDTIEFVENFERRRNVASKGTKIDYSASANAVLAEPTAGLTFSGS
ncbi:MAG: hypothetical protein M1831_006336 [Alyxoria varia]|nr:MAG: hypothetical protein M1831_006336 [Alyxoria varia]